MVRLVTTFLDPLQQPARLGVAQLGRVDIAGELDRARLITFKVVIRLSLLSANTSGLEWQSLRRIQKIFFCLPFYQNSNLTV